MGPDNFMTLCGGKGCTRQGPKRYRQHDERRSPGSCFFPPVGRSLIPDLPRFAEELFLAFPDIRQLNLIQVIRVPADVFDLSKEVSGS